MRGINLILRNSFRNTFRRPAKLIGLSALVALLSLVLSLVVNINARVIDGYNQLQKQSNLHTVVMVLDPFERVPTGNTAGYESAPTNLVAAQQYWLYQLQNKYKDDLDKAFYWSRTEGREFNQVYDGTTDLTLKVLAKTTPDNDLNHPLPGLGSQSGKVDDLIIFEGRELTKGVGHEVVVDNIFAQKHNLKINDIIRIQSDNYGDQIKVDSLQNTNITPTFINDLKIIKDQIAAPNSKGLNDPAGLYVGKYEQANDWYQVVGIGASVDFTMPVLNKSSPVPNRTKEGLLYVDSSVFGLHVEGVYGFVSYDQRDGRLTVTSNNEWEGFYSLANKNGKVPSETVIREMNLEFNRLIGKATNAQTYFYGRSDSNYRYALRTKALLAVVKYYSVGIVIFLVLLIIVIVFSITLILKKQVDHSRGQVGILKSLGYTPAKIGLNYSMTPIFTSVVGGIIGFAIAVPISNLLVRQFMNYFILDYGTSKFNWVAFVVTILAFFFFLNLITFIVINLIVRKNTAELVSGHKRMKVSRWAQFWKTQVADRPFNVKLQTALLLRASGKMSLVGAIVLIATILFTTFFAGPDILGRNQTASFYGVKYRQLVEYVEPTYNNPFSTYKTFNIEQNLSERAEYKLSAIANKYTSLPLKADGTFDLDKIASDYFNNTQSGEYYSVLFQANTLLLPLANQRFLAGYDLAPSIEYYRILSRLGITSSKGLAGFIFNQWPDYVTLLENLKSNDDLRQNLLEWQYFYRKVTNAIGLNVSDTFWADIKEGNNIPSDQTKINHFNEKNLAPDFANAKTAASKIIAFDSAQFNAKLTAIVQEIAAQGTEFQLTNDAWGVGSFKIQPPADKIPGGDIANYVDDYFAVMNINELSDGEVTENLKKMLVWFGALVEGRLDQGIVQAAYSRPSYFVQQAMKKAYNTTDQYIPYYQGFGVVPYDNAQEQYGTFFRVRKPKTGQNFKIYGIQNNLRFLDLRDKKDASLIQKLYQSRTENVNGENIYPIVINRSVAKTLGLSADSIVDLDVLQSQLTDNNREVTLNDWTIGNSPSSQNTFVPLNDSTSYMNWALKSGDKQLALFNFNSGLSDVPNAYYQEFLDGKLLNREISHPVKFKVIGVHQGYGDSQAWIKNDDANKILNWLPLQDFFWRNFFTSQWNGVFANTALTINGVANNFTANPIFDAQSPAMASYGEFKALLKDPDPAIRQSATIINQIFVNAYPLFNYKYSNKADVGDLSNAIGVYQVYGDYAPISMNGTTSSTNPIQGIAQGAMNNIVPISIKKEILSQISALVRLVLVLLIIAVILIAFVIVFLTVTLIIDDNVQFIATMKVLGYSDQYIVKAVLSMYFIVIAIAFVIGFIAGWFIFVTIVNALQPMVVLPLIFPAWLPFVVALAIGGIYLITLGIGYWTIIKTNPIRVLQSEVT